MTFDEKLIKEQKTLEEKARDIRAWGVIFSKANKQNGIMSSFYSDKIEECVAEIVGIIYGQVDRHEAMIKREDESIIKDDL